MNEIKGSYRLECLKQAVHISESSGEYDVDTIVAMAAKFAGFVGCGIDADANTRAPE